MSQALQPEGQPQSPSAAAPRTRPVVAIDGPAGAGKSTVAAHLARSFGYLNLETGAMYRALAYKAIDADLDLDEEAPLVALAQHTTILLEPTREGNRVLVDGRDVSRRIRDADVTAAASRVSVHAQVREWMVAAKRVLGAAGGVVMEGRDIGTAVFPDAEVKIFLDADPAVRGTRRYLQSAPPARQPDPDPEAERTLIAQMRERDERDRNRAESPLRPAPDAILLDSTGLTLPEVLERAESLVRGYLKRSAPRLPSSDVAVAER